MEVLLLGPRGAERDQVERLVTGAGHHVARCHDRSWGCAGLDGGCPVDDDGIDIALATPDPAGHFDPQGIVCAHRARIPIVAVGAVAKDPVLECVVANLAVPDDRLLEVMECMARDASGHRDAIETALSRHLGAGDAVTVAVERRPHRLEVILVSDLELTRASGLADVARTAARRHDPHIDVIDVSVVPRDGRASRRS